MRTVEWLLSWILHKLFHKKATTMRNIPDIGELEDQLIDLVKSTRECSAEKVYLAINQYLLKLGAEKLDIHLLKIQLQLTGQTVAQEGEDDRTVEACQYLTSKVEQLEKKFGAFVKATSHPKWYYVAHASGFKSLVFLFLK